MHMGAAPKHAVWRKCLIKTWEPPSVYLFSPKGGQRVSLEIALKADSKVSRPSQGIKGNSLAKEVEYRSSLFAAPLPPAPDGHLGLSTFYCGGGRER